MNPTVFDQLLEPVDEFVRKQDDELPKHHNQKFKYYDFFRILTYFFVSGGKSLRLFIDTKLKNNLLPSALGLIYVPYSTFGDAFERYPVALFQEVLQYLLSAISFKNIPELVAFGTLYCIDGSLFPVINSMLWAEYTSKHQSLKLHLCFELNRMIPVEFLVTAANYSERDALLKMLKSGITYIGDRGYMSFKVCHEIVKAEAFFIFRVKEKLKFSVTEKLKIELPTKITAIFENVTDELICYTNDKSNEIYRLVCFHVGTEVFRILTNRRDITTFQVIMLYAYRWQIELLFRFLKRTMNGIHLIKQDKKGVTIQFYILMISALLELIMKQLTVDTGENASSKEIDCNDKIPVGNQKENHIKNSESSKIDTEKPISCEYKFMETIGRNLKKYWKIGIHWLTALKTLLSEPFDKRAVEILNST
ncbi:MAG: IS4 family transposase [Bacteroidota bacterium]